MREPISPVMRLHWCTRNDIRREVVGTGEQATSSSMSIESRRQRQRSVNGRHETSKVGRERRGKSSDFAWPNAVTA